MMSGQHGWYFPPHHTRLEENDVHLWRASLNQSPSSVRAFWNLLTPDEQGRAERYHFRKDRDHFIVARGVLRSILSRYLPIRPDQLRFNYSYYGKPRLTDTIGCHKLSFNLSHSHEIALYAIGQGREVGVDIEFIREDFASLEMAQHFFSAREVAQLRALPAGERTSAFFRCWTRKEAYIKALGEGLSHPLHQFAVSLAPGGGEVLLDTGNGLAEPSGWHLYELGAGPGYVAALAVKGMDCRLSCWRWVEDTDTVG